MGCRAPFSALGAATPPYILFTPRPSPTPADPTLCVMVPACPTLLLCPSPPLLPTSSWNLGGEGFSLPFLSEHLTLLSGFIEALMVKGKLLMGRRSSDLWQRSFGRPGRGSQTEGVGREKRDNELIPTPWGTHPLCLLPLVVGRTYDHEGVSPHG